MKINKNLLKQNYNYLIINIGKLLEEGRKQAFYAVNNILVKTYWEIGKQIVEYNLCGITSKLFVSKYKLYLPKKEDLQMKLRTLLK